MPGYDDYVKQLEKLAKTVPDGGQYWMARDIQAALGYERWESFVDVIRRAMEACASSDAPVDYQFRQTTKMVSIGSGAQRATEDWFLSRYGCYLTQVL